MPSMQATRVLKLARNRPITINNFTQSLGAERLTNASFATWGGANDLTGWTETQTAPDPEVTQVGTGETHGGAGSGSANLFSSATGFRPQVTQAANTIGEIVEIASVCSAGTFGSNPIGRIDIDDGGTTVFNQYTAAGTHLAIGRVVSGGNFRILGVTAPIDATLDSVSCKLVTRNAAISWGVNGTLTHKFVLPASPVSRQQIFLTYRTIIGTGELLNGWAISLQRNVANNAWDMVQFRYSAGTATTVQTVTGVGTPNQIRVVVDGNDHTMYTGVDDVFTVRGTKQTNATHNSGGFINTIASSGFTQLQLSAA